MIKRLMIGAGVILAAITMTGQQKTFTCASLNVDGMPKSLLSGVVKLNPDAKEGPGATAIGQAISRQGWDFIALSEDFNYHKELMEPLKNFYYAGTYRGNLYNKLDVLTSPFDTDGLGFLWTKFVETSDESWSEWKTRNGKTSDGADELIKKGYRYYCVDFGKELSVDVYIHHMDAETSAKDNAARESQINQLVAAIRATDNHRPIIIMGDTNCRYTRDRIYELLIEGLNADPRFTCRDPWVDFNYDGKYNEFPLRVGDPALMTSQHGHDKGEVVDKIFYVNNTDAMGVELKANWIKSATDFTFPNGEPLSDHFPVVVNFTIENPNPTLSGHTYYMRNKGNGLFMTGGGSWGVHAEGDTYGYPFTLTGQGENAYKLHSPQGWAKSDAYLDGSEADAATYVIKPCEGGYTIQMPDGRALAATPGSATFNAADFNAADVNQQWELLTREELVENLGFANAENPVDATFFIKGANFNRNDGEISAWTWTKESKVNDPSHGGQVHNLNYEFYNDYHSSGYDKSYTKWTLTQTITGLPNGKYRLSCQGFYRDNDNNGTTNHAYLKGNDVEVPFNLISSDAQDAIVYNVDGWQKDGQTSTGKYCPNSQDGVTAYFDMGLYKISLDVTVTDGQLEIQAYKKERTQASSWSVVDNFRLTYLGPSEEMLAGRNRVKEAMDDAAERLAGLTNDAQGYYNNSLVEQAYQRNTLTADGREEVQLTYEALAAATKHQHEAGADMTYAIMNWSFEMGWMDVDRNLLYWPNHYMQDTGARPNSNNTYYTDNCDGEYLFNTWKDGKGTPVGQTLTGMPNGIYRLQALVTSDGGTQLYVYANGVTSESVTADDKTHFEEVEMQFMVTDGTITLGALAANAGVEPVLPVSSADELWGDKNAAGVAYTGSWYKADNFRLTLLAPESYAVVQAAIDDVNAKAKTAGLAVDLSAYQQAINDFTLTGETDDVVLEIYGLLADATKAVREAGSNYTNAMINPSFEMLGIGMNPFTGWDVMLGSDTKVLKPNTPENTETYGVSPVDGEYVFNTWLDGNIGYPISNTVKGLPAGKYRLTAKVASDKGNNYFLIAGNTVGEAAVTTEKTTFTDASVEFEVKQVTADVTVGVRSAKSGIYNPDEYGWWYKADDFRLILLAAYDQVEAPTGEYDDASQTLKVNAPAGATVLYAVLTEPSDAPALENALEDGIIDLSGFEDEVVYVYAVAIAEGMADSELTLLLDGQYVSGDPATTISYKPVNDASQIVHGNWYIIVAEHVEGAHALGLDHNAKPVRINSLGEIAATEELFAEVIEFQLTGADGNWTLTSKDGALTLGPAAPAPAVRRVASSTQATITLGDSDGTKTPATIAWGDTSLGFDHDGKEFGYTDQHSAPVMLYTTGKDMNTGVDEIEAADGEVEYYNLQGIRVNRPAHGLVIERRGGSATKVVL